MKKFYHANYSSNLMCLTVTGRHSLDELEALVKDKFAAVPNSDLRPPRISGECFTCTCTCESLSEDAPVKVATISSRGIQ